MALDIRVVLIRGEQVYHVSDILSPVSMRDQVLLKRRTIMGRYVTGVVLGAAVLQGVFAQGILCIVKLTL